MYPTRKVNMEILNAIEPNIIEPIMTKSYMVEPDLARHNVAEPLSTGKKKKKILV